MKYENTFKAIDQILWKEQGCGSELDYLEQKSWMLFLKYLDDLETEREDEVLQNIEIRSSETAYMFMQHFIKMLKVDRLRENYDKISQECDALKQAILRQVFE